MEIYHKLNEIVGVFGISGKHGHPMFIGEIVKLIPVEDWENKLIPKYLVKDLNSESIYEVTQNDIDRSGTLLKKYEPNISKSKVSKTKKEPHRTIKQDNKSNDSDVNVQKNIWEDDQLFSI